MKPATMSPEEAAAYYFRDLPKVMEVGQSSSDAAKYAYNAVVRRAEQTGFSKQPEGQKLLDAMRSYKQNVAYVRAPGTDSWSGQQDNGDFANMHEGILQEQVVPVLQQEQRKDIDVTYRVDWTMNSDGQFLRAYAKETGNQPEEDAIEAYLSSKGVSTSRG